MKKVLWIIQIVHADMSLAPVHKTPLPHYQFPIIGQFKGKGGRMIQIPVCR